MGHSSDNRDTASNFVPCFYFSFLTEISARKKVMGLLNKIELIKHTRYVALPYKGIYYEL